MSDEYFPLILESFYCVAVNLQIRSLYAISCRLKQEVQRILRDRCLLSESSLKDVWDAVACCNRVSYIAKRVIENALSDPQDMPLSALDSLFLSVSRLAGGIRNNLELGSRSMIYLTIYSIFIIHFVFLSVLFVRSVFLCVVHRLQVIDCVSDKILLSTSSLINPLNPS